MALSNAARSRIYGEPGKVDKVTVTTPWGIKVVVHRLIAAVFLQACRDAYENSPWRPQRIDSYANRPIRGSKQPSLHAYALAADFFATKPNVPPPGGVWTPINPVPPYFAACFTKRGFRWGATFDRVDMPHIEWPGPPPAEVLPDLPEEGFMAALSDDQQEELYAWVKDLHAALAEHVRPTHEAVAPAGPIDRQLKEIRVNTRP